jgi:hypothetical protein
MLHRQKKRQLDMLASQPLIQKYAEQVTARTLLDFQRHSAKSVKKFPTMILVLHAIDINRCETAHSSLS